ncbi:uroporphyrinogen-III synthase [Shewanella glacialimarina]|uniref:uroporphyrinogen-III synthase n=1 Tax=Shewanella glacialimarina TaxID=2590884 RepID=UPI001CF86CE9|nr:uroporphyrinogen-III synthase [Shewanella glacialimarina]UCX03415.1 uroporphyrinogen-III synthase [Shewanella glacialimarina]
MKVLLTRPEGRNQDMIEQLDKYQVAHIVTPLLGVEATHLPAPVFFDDVDNLIFISTNAVTFTAEKRHKLFPSQCRYFAVGQATADALKQYNLTVFSAPENSQDSEGLLSLPQLQHINKQSFIICRGSGGRETIAEQLELRGANVSYWDVYQRSRPTLDNQQVVSQWVDFGINTIVVTSGEILTNLIALIPKELFAWLDSCHIIVPSNRVKLQANALGLHRVTNANGANTRAILVALGLTA